MYQYNRELNAVAMAAGQYQFDVEKQLVSKIAIGLRSTGAPPVTPTVAQLKATYFVARHIAPGVDRELYNISLYDLAMLTDEKGGYSRDWTDTDLSDTNIIAPFGLDLRAEGKIQCYISVPATIANCAVSAYPIYDGQMPTTLAYRTQTTSGSVSVSNCFRLYSRDETGTELDLQVGNFAKKSIDFLMGKIMFAEQAKIEAETPFALLYSNPAPNLIKLDRMAGSCTFISVELP